LAKGYSKKPNALYGTWQKDIWKRKGSGKRPSAINGTWQKKGLSMLYGTWQKDTWKEKDIR
jgi:hypothetical protein